MRHVCRAGTRLPRCMIVPRGSSGPCRQAMHFQRLPLGFSAAVGYPCSAGYDIGSDPVWSAARVHHRSPSATLDCVARPLQRAPFNHCEPVLLPAVVLRITARQVAHATGDRQRTNTGKQTINQKTDRQTPPVHMQPSDRQTDNLGRRTNNSATDNNSTHAT